MHSLRRRDVLKAVGGTGVLLAVGAGSASARRGASAPDTIVDIAAATDDLSTLVAAVDRAGLLGLLSGNRQLTVLAPTNAAFEAFLASSSYASLDDVPADVLRAVLAYHVLAGRRYSESIVNAPRLPTLNGAPVTVDGTELNGGQAEIVATDVEASNGVVHLLDGVLTPP
jgi:uncharacterized surface protein with fasciclin (FAS1) repeats